jgi:site-specific DNA recombinase
MVYFRERSADSVFSLSMLLHFIYCRKSSEDEDRQVISNESQENELHPIAERDHLKIRDKIKEEASAKVPGTRPQFNQMVTRIKKGEANAILCWHLNRLSRNATDAAVLVDLMDQGRLLEIRTPGQTFRNTPGDKFLITLFGSQAKLENDNKGVDVKRGLRAKATMGLYPGVAPTGFLNDKTKNRGERDLYKDPERFDLVKKMWRMMLAGTYTAPQIVKIANERWGFRTRRTKKQGGNPLGLNTIYHIFHNPFYYGWFEYPVGSGKWYQGKHEPMITKAEFDRVQTILGRNGNPRASKHLTFSYTGLIRCGGCTGMVTAEEKHQVRCTVCRKKFSYTAKDRCPRCNTPVAEMSNPRFRDYTYYHCARRKNAKCSQRSLEVTKLERQIEKQLRRIQISATFKRWAFRFLQEVYENDINMLRSTTQSRENAIADCVKKLEGLVELKTSPANADGSLLSDEEYIKHRRELLQAKAALQSPESEKIKAEQALRQSEESFEFAHAALNKFIDGDFQAKKEVLTTMGSNHSLVDENLIIEAMEPFVLIQKLKSSKGAPEERIEPEKTSALKGRNGRTRDPNLSVLRDVKEVRTNERKLKILVRKVYHFFRSSKIDDQAKGVVRKCRPHRFNLN